VKQVAKIRKWGILTHAMIEGIARGRERAQVNLFTGMNNDDRWWVARRSVYRTKRRRRQGMKYRRVN